MTKDFDIKDGHSCVAEMTLAMSHRLWAIDGNDLGDERWVDQKFHHLEVTLGEISKDYLMAYGSTAYRP